MKTEEEQEKDKYDLKNNNSWMNEIKGYKKLKENEEKVLNDMVAIFLNRKA